MNLGRIVKLNETAEKLLPIKRTREIPQKNNENDLASLLDPEFRKEVIKC